MDGWIPVQVSVPQRRLGEFHEMFGRWLRTSKATSEDIQSQSNDAVSTSSQAPGNSREGSWLVGTEETRLHDAKQVYRQLSPEAQRILDYWLDHHDRRIPASELVKELGFKSINSIAGTLASFGFQSKKVGRQLPFLWGYSPDGSSYWMEPEVNALFRQAREAANR